MQQFTILPVSGDYIEDAMVTSMCGSCKLQPAIFLMVQPI
jgi:hypothetical protein